MEDEFAGPHPSRPVSIIGNFSNRREIVDTLKVTLSPEILMKNHGPFTVGKDGRAAVKDAVMVEEVAKAAHLARTIGSPEIVDDQAVDSLYDRYQNVYGQ